MAVQYPEIRKQIGFLIEALCSADDPARAQPQDVSLAAHYFLEDWELDGEPEKLSGTYLEPSEVAPVANLTRLCAGLVQKHGWELTSMEYTAKAEWAAIKEAARVARDSIGK